MKQYGERAQEIKNYLERNLSKIGDFDRLNIPRAEEAQIDYELRNRHLVSLRELRNYKDKETSFNSFCPHLFLSPDYNISVYDGKSFVGEKRLITILRHRFFNHLKSINSMVSMESYYSRLNMTLDLERDKEEIVSVLSIILPYEQFVDSKENKVRAKEYLEQNNSLDKKINSLKRERVEVDKKFHQFINNQITWKN